ncbi:DUF2316 family protein [Corynebacterium uberis]|uniref:DUF2316 family protein n=1 Tax=Corynebacterium TaxID=1716 RepID=UPI001D0AE300|nr:MULTISPECIES: DUF2316 family protein [Corynebacterium]MCZ9310182.1 DUF2316 family protein [Corynebacterium sp. c6VSa_13]UDL73320.1 DUF2316 family protein [Corynebacterium uberis]UDL75802.1 DUF2316 family protein [Corynebacterium uberis]UDL78015.1 DUF2316 family protein [Corynebacterium uberis]UDL80297.1 DUF2316 family protein [Corynebacterium uberis]
MSLSVQQLRATAAELRENMLRAGLTPADLPELTGLDARRAAAALAVAGASPADVWLLRDRLDTAVLRAGARPAPYSALTEDMRAAAAAWFGVRDEH